jgi:putative oxidoreductase
MTEKSPASTDRAPRRRGLHVLLWVLQVLLALFFLLAGYSHAIVPLEALAKTAAWVTGVRPALVRFIGLAELAGAIGLVLPAATRIAPSLTPLAAAGLAIIMVLAVPFHIMRGEANVIGFNLAVGAVAAFVAWGRYRLAPILPRAER